MPAAALCAAALALGHAGPAPVARATCEHVTASAVAWGVPPELAVALAWHESGLSPVAVSRAGAVGALQVMPRVRRGAVDLTGAGVEELRRLLGRHSAVRAVMHYNCGLCAAPSVRAKSERWARAVLATAAALQTIRTGEGPGEAKADLGVVEGAVPSLSLAVSFRRTPPLRTRQGSNGVTSRTSSERADGVRVVARVSRAGGKPATYAERAPRRRRRRQARKVGGLPCHGGPG